MKKLLNIDPRIRVKPVDLMDEIMVIRVKHFHDDAAEKFSQEMSKAHNTGQPVIPVVIDSFGGMIHSLLAMMADIDHATLPVATIAVGKAMSCGALLLSCGTDGYRFADPSSSVMIHDASAWECGKIEELKSGIKETERLNNFLYHRMAKNCGHRDMNYFLKLIHDRSHAEVYLTAKEAVRHKIVNHVRVPQFTTDVIVKTTFG